MNSREPNNDFDKSFAPTWTLEPRSNQVGTSEREAKDSCSSCLRTVTIVAEDVPRHLASALAGKMPGRMFSTACGMLRKASSFTGRRRPHARFWGIGANTAIFSASGRFCWISLLQGCPIG